VAVQQHNAKLQAHVEGTRDSSSSAENMPVQVWVQVEIEVGSPEMGVMEGNECQDGI